jgi:hypothetical protein
MVLVRPGLDGAANHRARDVAELGRVVVGFDADLCQRVGAGLIRQQIIDRLVHVDAIQRVVVLLLALAIDEWAPCTEVLRLRKAVGLGRDHARQEQGELREIAAVERHALDRGPRYDLADDRILSLEDRIDGSDFDLLRRTHRKGNVNPRILS